MKFILLLLLGACQTPEPLNSERIVARYGSYGVAILRANDHRRLSSLYSEHQDLRTMRTLAYVEFQRPGRSDIANLHRKIVAGASIGATFKKAGWKILKSTLDICEIDTTVQQIPELATMRIDLPAKLAMHRYNFIVVKDSIRIDYAVIAEIYHPDYLRIGDLKGTSPDAFEQPGETKDIKNENRKCALFVNQTE